MAAETDLSLSLSLLSFMSSSDCCIFEYSELEEWYDDNLNEKKTKHSLKDLLDQLIKTGKVKCRKESLDEKSCDVYWPLLDQQNPNSVHEAKRNTASLKRSWSQFVPPGIVSKRFKSSDRGGGGGGGGVASDSDRALAKEKKDLMLQLSEKERQLQKLRLVKLYRTKNDLDQLEVLVHKWRNVSQEAAEELLELSPHKPRPTMAELLNYLHIDPNIIHYSVDDESFY